MMSKNNAMYTLGVAQISMLFDDPELCSKPPPHTPTVVLKDT